nr:MAG TPA: hypothetical protein [Caudoviricetes sp.]
MFYNLDKDIFGELINWRMVHRRMSWIWKKLA